MSKVPKCERLESGAYSVRITDPFRPDRRIRITEKTQAQVLAKRDEVLRVARDFREGTIGPREAQRLITRAAFGAPTVAEVWTLYEATLRASWRRSVKSTWRTRIEPYFGNRRVWELGPQEMAQWERDELDKGFKPKTIDNAFQCLKAAIRQAIPDRVTEIPWRNWRPRGAPKGLAHPRESCRSLVEFELLMNAAKRYDENLDARGIRPADCGVRIIVGLLLGLRQGEMAALGWDDLFLEEDPPYVRIVHASQRNWRAEHPLWTRPQDTPKGNKQAELVIHAHCARALVIHRNHMQKIGFYKADGPVFPGPTGQWRERPICIDPNAFRAIVREAGLPNPEKWTPHSLRHSFASAEVRGAFQLTGDIQSAKSRTRHTRIQTLENYLHQGQRETARSFIGAISQESLPLLPASSERTQMRMLQAAATKALTKIAEASAIDPIADDERKMKEKDLAKKYPRGEAPRVIIARAEARYRRAYSKAKRQNRQLEACQQEGKAARRGYMMAWKKIQAAANESTDVQNEVHEGAPGGDGDSAAESSE